jgi:hypothetical protein
VALEGRVGRCVTVHAPTPAGRIARSPEVLLKAIGRPTLISPAAAGAFYPMG